MPHRMAFATGLGTSPRPQIAPASSASSSTPRTPRHSTYRSQFVVIEYPWHPLHGKRLRLVQRGDYRGRDSIRVETPTGPSSELPAWMCSASACASITVGTPVVTIEALQGLSAALKSLLPNRMRRSPVSFRPKKEALDATTLKPATSTTRARSSARDGGAAASTGVDDDTAGAGRSPVASPRRGGGGRGSGRGRGR